MKSTIKIIRAIGEELDRAEFKHPDFPSDVIHQVSIMNEESGEAIKAAIDYIYHNGTLYSLKNELIQTAAMCIRVLKNLP